MIRSDAKTVETDFEVNENLTLCTDSVELFEAIPEKFESIVDIL